MRAREPDHRGHAANNGVRLYYEVFGAGPQTLLLVPPYHIVSSRLWKMQTAFLARRYRTVVYDPRGNGRSDRPHTGYGIERLAGDALAVLDHLDIERCGLVGVSGGAYISLHLAARYPDRVTGIVVIGAASFIPGPPPDWEQRRAARLADYDRYVVEFWDVNFPEPHSSKAKDDGWAWAHETDAHTLVTASEECWFHVDVRPIAPDVRCPVLVIHGTDDRRIPHEAGRDLHARLAGSRMVTLERAGHVPNVRDPVKVNLLVREFFEGPGKGVTGAGASA